jgi:CO/xanthine dehydrogenase Mo-binding subunit
MTTPTTSKALDEVKIGGLGASRKRVEDDRFIRGKGNYLDDITLPGMLHMEILRSPLAHARIAKIDTSRAWEIPGVRLVLTGEMMATRNLAWMPTLSYDTQAVLATDKVRFQGQEVACVIADDPYIAKDACEAIDVEYEPLPAIVNPMQAQAPAAPIIRDDKDGQASNVIYDWEVGDKAGTERAFQQADVISKLELHYPRSHPSPIECCGSVADFNRATGKLTVYMTTQAPHIIRAAVAMVAELPEHMIRIVSPDIGGGFGNKVPVYPGYVMSILASILLERPVKWIEDKTGNLISTGFARDIYLKGELGIGISTMTEPLGAGNSREFDILGIKMFDSADLKVHMTGKALLRTGARTQGQGHETTWAQIVAHELGIPAEDVIVEEGDTDTAPFGMGTYASRSTPVAGAAVSMVARKIRAKARKLAAHLLEVSEEDIEWELGRFYIRSAPERGVTIQECAMAAYSNMPDGMEPGLENTAYYDPPNLTWPFAVYIATVEVDPVTGVWDVLKMVAVDDCGVRINPMIVEGQIMGGLTEAYAMASMQFITYDADGNCIGSNYMDYMLPSAWETPGFELHSEVVTPCPHHPLGAKGIGECAAVGGPAAFVNAVMDALSGTGVRNIDMPLLPDRVWEALTQRHDVSGHPPVKQD